MGYVVPREHSALSVTELRRYLQEKLPEYMIPSSFVVLEALPLMPNGKVDRNRLPPPDGTRLSPTGEFVAPRTEIEELIAQTWREVLKIENLGIYDNFFELGGHSLLATQIVARLQEAFNKEVPLRVLFDAPTIAELAQELETIIREGHAPELPPIVPVPRDGPLPLSMNQEHLWRLDQMMPGTDFFNMPYVYRLSGDLNVQALEKAIGEIIRRHEALRTVFAEVHGRPVQIIRGSPFQLPVVDFGNLAADQISEQAAWLILAGRQESFDLAGAPPIRIKLFRLTDTENFLLVTMHHIVSDHWSMQVFRRELTTLYEAFVQGRTSPLADSPTQFADYAVQEKQSLESGLFNAQLDYWRKQLAPPLPELEFNPSRPRNKELTFQTARESIEMGESLFREIKALAARENCTLFMIVVAALNLVLHELTGQEDIRIGTLVANRRWENSEAVIGHFINTAIIRTKVNSSNLRELLANVREAALTAYAHQELPFEQLAQILETEKKIKRTTLFQVLLIYQKSSFESANASGLKFAPLGWQLPVSDSEVTVTACDLIINVRETSTTLTASVNYKTDFVAIGFVASMIDRFTTILQQMTLQTHQPITPINTDAQAEQSLTK